MIHEKDEVIGKLKLNITNLDVLISLLILIYLNDPIVLQSQVEGRWEGSDQLSPRDREAQRAGDQQDPRQLTAARAVQGPEPVDRGEPETEGAKWVQGQGDSGLAEQILLLDRFWQGQFGVEVKTTAGGDQELVYGGRTPNQWTVVIEGVEGDFEVLRLSCLGVEPSLDLAWELQIGQENWGIGDVIRRSRYNNKYLNI